MVTDTFEVLCESHSSLGCTNKVLGHKVFACMGGQGVLKGYYTVEMIWPRPLHAHVRAF